MATNSSNLPNTVPGAAATSATFPAYIYDYKLRGLPRSVPVYSSELGPEHPASLCIHIRGTWRELKYWWKHFGKYFDDGCKTIPNSFTSPPSLTQPAHTMPQDHPYSIRPGDNLNICRECLRVLSRRSCDGKTVISYQGCDFHREHPDVPFAYRCRGTTQLQTSNLFRAVKETLWNPETLVTTFYLSKNPFPDMGPIMATLSGGPVFPADPSGDATQSTDDGTAEAVKGNLVSLEHVPFLHRYRAINERANLPRVEYLHVDDCLHGSNPDCIVQGTGLEGLYYKRCDGRFVNALGNILPPTATDSSVAVDKPWAHTLDPPPPPLTTSLQPPSAALAEAAWRRLNPTAGPNSWKEIKAQRKRLEAEEAAARRAEKRSTLVSRAGGWMRRRG